YFFLKLNQNQAGPQVATRQFRSSVGANALRLDESAPARHVFHDEFPESLGCAGLRIETLPLEAGSNFLVCDDCVDLSIELRGEFRGHSLRAQEAVPDVATHARYAAFGERRHARQQFGALVSGDRKG